MSVEAAVPVDAPMMKAWTAYKLTPEYENTKRWAADKEHTEGSLWHVFVQGFVAAGGKIWPETIRPTGKEGKDAPKNCTCPPDEAPIPCQHGYALSVCLRKDRDCWRNVAERRRREYDAANDLLKALTVPSKEQMQDRREQVARIIEPELDAHLENQKLSHCRALVGLAYDKADAILSELSNEGTQ